MHKVITFGIPSYNAAKDKDHCITSILEGSNYATDIEIIVVDDGSKDETAAKADEWEARYPGIIRAVHQENGGHGIAVLSGLREAQGTYYKVVDSDDWLDGAALSTMLSILRGFEERDQRVDLFISNYVYEKVYEGTHTAIGYKFALPRKKIFSWDQIGTRSMWTTSTPTCHCRVARPCTTPTSTSTATLSVAKVRASTRQRWSSVWTSRSVLRVS